MEDIGTKATVAKLKELMRTADEKKAEMHNRGKTEDAVYYAGVRDGINRALAVVQGRG